MKFAPCNPLNRRLNGWRVLLVEDEALIAMLLEEALLDAGAVVIGPITSVGGALRVLDSIDRGRPLDAAVLDFNLAGECVMPVADRLAALGVPIVFASGYGEGAQLGAHRASPMQAKPFEPEALIDVIDILVRG